MKTTPTDAREARGSVILIVEDNALMRAMLRRLVGTAFPFHVIHTAANGAAALELARQHQPRVVLMDIGLPDTNGITLTARITEMLPETRVIMVTLFAGSPYEELARAAGAFGYVVKERVSSELSPLIDRALEAGQREGATKPREEAPSAAVCCQGKRS